GEIDTLADPDAGMTDEQQRVAGDIVALQEFLLDEAILFGSQWTRETGVGMGEVIRMEQANQGGQLVEPRPLLHHTAWREDMQIASGFDEWRLLRAKPGQPAQNMWVPTELVEGPNAG